MRLAAGSPRGHGRVQEEKQICTTGVSFFLPFSFFEGGAYYMSSMCPTCSSSFVFPFFRLSTAECDAILKEIKISPLSDRKCVILFLYTLIVYIPRLSFVYILSRCVTITTSNQF
jgi:hypothetical protein